MTQCAKSLLKYVELPRAKLYKTLLYSTEILIPPPSQTQAQALAGKKVNYE